MSGGKKREKERVKLHRRVLDLRMSLKYIYIYIKELVIEKKPSDIERADV
jgi:hypothetical protein